MKLKPSGYLLLISLFASISVAQDLSAPEFTPVCNECTYGVRFKSPDGFVGRHDLYLSDIRVEGGRSHLYRGPSWQAYLTVSGSPTVSIQTCYPSGVSCSDFVEFVLSRPQNQQSELDVGDFTIRDPISLIHALGPDAPNRFAVDISATGNKVCGIAAGDRIWNLGGRAMAKLPNGRQIKLRNTFTREYFDGSWTWTGDVRGRESGTLALTVSNCDEPVVLSIRSTAGNYLIRGGSVDSQPAREFEALEPPRDCAVPTAYESLDIVSFPEPWEVQTTSGGNTESFSFAVDDRSDIDELFAAVRFFGENSGHSLESFYWPIRKIVFSKDLSISVDFRAGSLSESGSRWVWQSCADGQAGSNVALRADKDNRSLRLIYAFENVHGTMRYADGIVHMTRFHNRLPGGVE